MLDVTQPASLAAKGLTLFGVGASPGFARGRARAVRSRADLARLRPDEVLVVDALPNKWLPALPHCRAAVTETGGPLQFSARVLREHGVPAVVGVAGALAKIADGDQVEVDGSLGMVRVPDQGQSRSSQHGQAPASS